VDSRLRGNDKKNYLEVKDKIPIARALFMALAIFL